MERFRVTLLALALLAGVSAIETGEAAASRDFDRGRSSAGSGAGRPALEDRVARLRRIILPLLRAADRPRRPSEVRVRLVESPAINAASAGNGEFYVTTGLLARAGDEELRGVLAHEIAHDDLGHPAEARMLNAGIGIGALLLERIFPGSSAFAPVAGGLIASRYSRPQEYEADRHAVTILRRAGYGPQAMVRALEWIMRVEGDRGGGFFSTHPATRERIAALRRLAEGRR
jgi:predicted Zn-dependent protease